MNDIKYILTLITICSVVLAQAQNCGLIQISIVLDNNCNGIYDSGDSYSKLNNVTLMQNGNIIKPSKTTDNGRTFYANLTSGNYTSTIDIPNGWEVSNTSQSAYLNEDDIVMMTYYLCESCGCLETSGPPEQNLTIPNSVFPRVGLNFRITDPDYAPHQIGAYNSNKYLLVIFNRRGGEVHRSSREDCNGLKNGEIMWNGLDKNGNHLAQDNYNGYLVLQNCDYGCKNDEWSSNFFNGLLNKCPLNVKYFNIILAH